MALSNLQSHNLSETQGNSLGLGQQCRLQPRLDVISVRNVLRRDGRMHLVHHEVIAIDAVIYVAAMFGAVFLARTGLYLQIWVNYRESLAEIRRLPIELFW